ncbi:unnamed protein product [Linum trigynum]|uniref:Uncharacterized protein n=1 Tax=Linum trigynum TaxID=586398 RepID=A0AAV2DDS9_9ROSI
MMEAREWRKREGGDASLFLIEQAVDGEAQSGAGGAALLAATTNEDPLEATMDEEVGLKAMTEAVDLPSGNPVAAAGDAEGEEGKGGERRRLSRET